MFHSRGVLNPLNLHTYKHLVAQGMSLEMLTGSSYCRSIVERGYADGMSVLNQMWLIRLDMVREKCGQVRDVGISARDSDRRTCSIA